MSLLLHSTGYKPVTKVDPDLRGGDIDPTSQWEGKERAYTL